MKLKTEGKKVYVSLTQKKVKLCDNKKEVKGPSRDKTRLFGNFSEGQTS